MPQAGGGAVCRWRPSLSSAPLPSIAKSPTGQSKSNLGLRCGAHAPTAGAQTEPADPRAAARDAVLAAAVPTAHALRLLADGGAGTAPAAGGQEAQPASRSAGSGPVDSTQPALTGPSQLDGCAALLSSFLRSAAGTAAPAALAGSAPVETPPTSSSEDSSRREAGPPWDCRISPPGAGGIGEALERFVGRWVRAAALRACLREASLVGRCAPATPAAWGHPRHDRGEDRHPQHIRRR